MSRDIVTIWTYHDYIEAELAKIKLEAADILCYIAGDNFAATQPYYSMFSGIELCVKSPDAERAIAILKDKELSPESAEIPESENEPVEICPYCGSTNIEQMKVAIFSVIVFFFIGRFVPWPSKKHRCLSCWRSWKPNQWMKTVSKIQQVIAYLGLLTCFSIQRAFRDL